MDVRTDVSAVEPAWSKCKFGAISLNEYGVAEVDEEKCIGCGACVKVCPQKVIHIHECANWMVVKCSNKSKGAGGKKTVSGQLYRLRHLPEDMYGRSH